MLIVTYTLLGISLETLVAKKFFITLILNYAIKRFITIIIIELFWLIFLPVPFMNLSL